MVLLGPYLYHKWDADAALLASGQHYRVVTIQFGMDLFNAHLMQKERFYKVRKLLTDSVRGIKFSHKTIGEAIPVLLSLTQDKGFANVIEFFTLLDMLSKAEERSFLASEGFTPQAVKTDNHRMQTAYAYILKNFANPNIKIGDLANLVNMSESAFSHFFQKNTNKSFTQFLIDVRIGHACKMLLDGASVQDSTTWQISTDCSKNTGIRRPLNTGANIS
jgi:AraC-like DNA-binding protein